MRNGLEAQEWDDDRSIARCPIPAPSRCMHGNAHVDRRMWRLV